MTTSFNNLDIQAFESNPIEEFRRVAGGLPEAPKKYKNISSNDKDKLLWNFFDSDFATPEMLDAKTVYSGKEDGATIRELITLKDDGDRDGKNNIHSIEHVVPKGFYEGKLETSQGLLKSNGASINPLNLVPSYGKVNGERGRRVFDFDGDDVTSPTVEDSRKFEAGIDDDGEWVVKTLMTRGDIARCVMYMEMMYDLNYVDEKKMRVCQKWMKEDEPSEFEKAFGLWLRETKPYGMNVQNPFISNPELAGDEMFNKLLSSYLGTDPKPEEPIIVIDSVLANPEGKDLSGKELITLRNTTDNVVDLEDWTLGIVTKNDDVTYSLDGSSINGGVSEYFVFDKYNALSNSLQTTITLRDSKNEVISEFKYSKQDVRVGRVLKRLKRS